MNKQNNTSTYDETNWTLNTILYSLAVFGLIIFAVIIYNMYISFAAKDFNSATGLLVPLGVLISAALASTSVMKSIHNTNIIEKAKEKEKIINADKYFTSILMNMRYYFSPFSSIGALKKILKNEQLNYLQKSEISTDEEEKVNQYARDIQRATEPSLENLKIYLEKLLEKLETKDLIYYSTNLNNIEEISKLISNVLGDIAWNLKLFHDANKHKDKQDLYLNNNTIDSVIRFIANTEASIIKINTYIDDDDLKIVISS